MKHRDVLMFFLLCLVAFHTGSSLYAQGSGGDVLNETPLFALPSEMTFEEYRDMNRRLTVGLVLAAVPIPGMIHFYAGEKKTGWVILGSAAIGVTSIVAGFGSADEGDFPDSDFEQLVLNAGDTDRERRFELVPYENTDGEVTYRYREIFRQPDDAGWGLIVLGAAILIADITYDIVHGVKVIEEKRDRVRYKYGRQLKFGVNPQIDPKRKTVGLGLALRF